MGASHYLVDSVAVDLNDEGQRKKAVTDPNTLSPVPCLSIAGKRTAQNFHMAIANSQKNVLLGHTVGVVVDEMYKNDPMPLQATRIREQLRLIDGRNVVGARHGVGLSSPRESRADIGLELAAEYDRTAALLSHERFLTPGLEKRYGGSAGKGSLIHPHAYDHGIMGDTVGQHALKGGARQAKGLQTEVIGLARMHASEIEKKHREAERENDMEQLLIRRSFHREAAMRKYKGNKGSACFKAVTRDKGLVGSRMLPPTSTFGPGHYNISYLAQDPHSGIKDMKSTYASLGRQVIHMPPDVTQRRPSKPDHEPPAAESSLEPAADSSAEQPSANRRASDAGGEAQQHPNDNEEGKSNKQQSGSKGRLAFKGAEDAKAAAEAAAASGAKSPRKGGKEGSDGHSPLTSSFRNTGFRAPLVGRDQPKNGGAHLGPAKYSANYNSVRPGPKSIAVFDRQLNRPPLLDEKDRPGPGAYEPDRPLHSSTFVTRESHSRTRGFEKQIGRPKFHEEHDTRPATAPVVVHTASPLPFSPPAMTEPYAPVEALRVLRSQQQARGATPSRLRPAAGAGPPSPSTSHQAIVASWGSNQRPGTVPGSFADAGMGMWFDETGTPLTSAVAIGWGTDRADPADVAWQTSRFGGRVGAREVTPDQWATGGLRAPPKMGTMPKSTRTDEVRGIRITQDNKAGYPVTAPKCQGPDPRSDLNPKHTQTETRSPAWSLPKNRTDKQKRWTPPRWLIEQHS